MSNAKIVCFGFVLASCGSANGSSTRSDTANAQLVVTHMHDSLVADLEDLRKASADLQNAAPVPSGRGWDADKDADAIAAMTEAWIRARTAYEHIEGALAPLFPEIDASIDARYDDFLTDIGPDGDSDLFDDDGVTGLHAIERILWAGRAPESVVTFESSLPGYQPAAFPATAGEAAEFKAKLCKKLVADADELKSQWTPAQIDLPEAFQGLIALMNEQREKVNKASSNEEESRYSQRTMADIRDNLEGTQKIYALFQGWIVSKEKSGGASDKDIDNNISAGFARLKKLYDATQGNAIPAPPTTWSAEDPSQKDLTSDFGALYEGVHAAVDPEAPDSIVFNMNAAATLLGFPEFSEE